LEAKQTRTVERSWGPYSRKCSDLDFCFSQWRNRWVVH